MRMLNALRRSGQEVPSSGRIAHPLTAEGELDATVSRHEPRILAARGLARDPYAVWLEQRDAERELEQRQPIRWVHRQRIADAPAIALTAVSGHEQREPCNADRRTTVRLLGV
jgi:hypothetical protein